MNKNLLFTFLLTIILSLSGCSTKESYSFKESHFASDYLDSSFSEVVSFSDSSNSTVPFFEGQYRYLDALQKCLGPEYDYENPSELLVIPVIPDTSYTLTDSLASEFMSFFEEVLFKHLPTNSPTYSDTLIKTSGCSILHLHFKRKDIIETSQIEAVFYVCQDGMVVFVFSSYDYTFYSEPYSIDYSAYEGLLSEYHIKVLELKYGS